MSLWRLELEAEKGDVPEELRMRQILKHALRVQGFRCKRVEQVLDTHVTMDSEKSTKEQE